MGPAIRDTSQDNQSSESVAAPQGCVPARVRQVGCGDDSPTHRGFRTTELRSGSCSNTVSGRAPSVTAAHKCGPMADCPDTGLRDHESSTSGRLGVTPRLSELDQR